MNELYMKEALIEAQKAFKEDEVPIGAVIVCNDIIIARGYNIKKRTNVCLNHAEIVSIIKAEEVLKDWRLSNCDMYVTLEPCNMCKEAIKQSRLRNVYYLLKSEFYNEIKRDNCFIEYDDDNFKEKKEYRQILRDFFNNKR